MDIKNILIGADPEFFLLNKNTGKYVPAVGLIGGTKDEPIPISDKGHCIQEDNVMVEFNVPASNDSKQFYKDVQFVLDHIKKMVPENFELAVHASAFFETRDLQTEQALTFGCEPDFNVWTGEANMVSIANPLLRSAGGHVHIGYDKPDETTSLTIIAHLDLFLGVPSILLDKDTERRKLYGKAGAYRLKKYGCEYRVLSNFWIANQQLVDWCFENVKAAVEFITSGKQILPEDYDKIIACINNSDKELSEILCKKYNINHIIKELIAV